MNQLTKYLLVGVGVILAVKIFRLQEGVSDNIIQRAKNKTPEDFAAAAALTLILGAGTVIAAQAFRKV